MSNAMNKSCCGFFFAAFSFAMFAFSIPDLMIFSRFSGNFVIKAPKVFVLTMFAPAVKYS
jgi:hypothetical protein